MEVFQNPSQTALQYFPCIKKESDAWWEGKFRNSGIQEWQKVEDRRQVG
jgi:hypothetical protein